MQRIPALMVSLILVSCGPALTEAPPIAGMIDPAVSGSFDCSAGGRILRESDETPSMREYRSAFYLYECDTDEDTIILWDGEADIFEIARGPYADGAKITLDLLSSSLPDVPDMLAVTLGYEPSSDDGDDTHIVSLYDLRSMALVFNGQSRREPKIGDRNGDGVLEMVLSENLFSVDHYAGPGWPWMVELSRPVRHVSVRGFPSVLRQHRDESTAIYTQFEEFCESLAPERCPLEDTLVAFEAQIEALDFLLVNARDSRVRQDDN